MVQPEYAPPPPSDYRVLSSEGKGGATAHVQGGGATPNPQLPYSWLPPHPPWWVGLTALAKVD